MAELSNSHYMFPRVDTRELVVCAMSGGVDSSAAALLLDEQGYRVVGISMQVWDYRKNGGASSRATCCSPADFEDARTVAASKGIPFYVFDFESSFKGAVIDPFVRSYLEGETPNPCLECNRKVKFKELRNRARALGAEKVATGHYAQILELPEGGYGLFTGADETKDQSYFLYAMTQQDLQTTLFPVGGMQKAEVREYLSRCGQQVATKAESQDICFVSGEVGDFVERAAGKKTEGGDIVSSSGEKLGTHAGVHRYTVGQRKGLGLSNPSPLYVLSVDADSRQVTVGEKNELARESFFLREVNWVSGVVPDEELELDVKLRYRHDGVRCRVKALSDSSAKVTFLEQWSAVSPGQAAVFYHDYAGIPFKQVLGGGIIEKSQD